MGLFRDDTDYTFRQTGFARYKQLISFYGFHWLRLNMIAFAGFLPLAAAVWFSIMTSSLMVLLPLSFLGGMIFGPFMAGLVDAIMRGLRDAPGNWWKNYKKSWRQNWKDSLVPSGVLGMLAGLVSFMVYVLLVSQVPVPLSTWLMLLVSVSAIIWFCTLYWPQQVLFSQRFSIRVRNAVLFTIKHSLRVLGSVLIQLIWLLLLVLLAPWTFTVVPFLGFWFPVFLAELNLYKFLNEDLSIEAQFIPVEGDPWAKDHFEEFGEAEEESALPDDGIRHWEELLHNIEENKEDPS